MIKWGRWCLRTVWWTLAALVILLAVVVQIGREFTPQLDQYSDDLAQYLSEQIDMAVVVESFSADWHGLTPQLALENVKIVAADGVVVLEAAAMAVELDLLKSIYEGHLRWRGGKLSDVMLNFQQSPAGRWGLYGVTAGTSDSGKSLAFINMVRSARQLSFSDINLRFDFVSGRQTAFTLSAMSLQQRSDFLRLVGELDLPDQSDVVKLVIEQNTQFADTSAGVKAYLQVRDLPVDRVEMLSEVLADQSIVKNSRVNLSLWLESNPSGGVKVPGDLAAANNELPLIVSSKITGQYQHKNGWRIGFNDLNINYQHTAITPFALELYQPILDGALDIRVSQLQLAEWHPMFTQESVPESLAKTLESLQPTGTVSSLQLTLPIKDPSAFGLKANLQQVAVKDWFGSPAVSGIDGYIEADKRGGHLDLDSHSGFSMHYVGVYDAPLVFDEATGQIGWRVSKDENKVQVNSGLLQMRAGETRAAGKFLLQLPWYRHSKPGELTIQLGIQDVDALDYRRYVPAIAGEQTREWLSQSIKAGAISQAGFIFHGALAKSAESHASSSVQFYADIQGGQLRYHPDWPMLNAIDGQLVVDNGNVNVESSSALFLQSHIRDATVTLGSNPEGEGRLLWVQGSVAGPANDALRILNSDALASQLGNTFKQWQLTGTLDADLDLHIPLQAEAKGQHQWVKATLSGNDLFLGEINLGLEQLTGDVIFDSHHGLAGEKLEGRLWQQPFKAILNYTPDYIGTLIDIDGVVNPQALAHWLARPELLFASGESTAQATLTIPFVNHQQNPIRLAVSSSLVGTDIKLPAPYGKGEAEPRKLDVDVLLAGADQDAQIQLADNIQVALQRRDGRYRVGVTLEDAASRDIEGVAIDGHLTDASLDDWYPVLQRYQQFLQSFRSDVSEDDGDSIQNDLPVSAQLTIDRLNVRGTVINNVKVVAQEAGGVWDLMLENPWFRGQSLWFGNQRPPSMLFDYIHIPQELLGIPASPPEITSSAADQVAPKKSFFEELSPSDFFDVDVVVNDLSIGDKAFGHWSTKVRVEENTLQLQNVEGGIRGIRVSGDDAGGGVFTWRKDTTGARSYLSAVLQSADLGYVQTSWGQPRSIETEKAKFDIDFSWTGHPDQVSLNQLEGIMAVDMKNGRFNAGATGGSSVLLRLIGLFNFDSWARRLKLDFSDTFNDGTTFDNLDGLLSFDQGMIYLKEPVVVKTPSARLQMAGTIDVNNEYLDTTLVARLPVGGNLAVAAAFAAGLPAAAGVYVISKLFESQVDKVASLSYSMKGTWSNPDIQFQKLFDSKAAKRAAKEAEDRANSTADSANIPQVIEAENIPEAAQQVEGE